MGLQFTDKAGQELPTTRASMEKMAQDKPKAEAFLKRHDAQDLSEMLFGEVA